MALLVHASTGRTFSLSAHVLVGRSSACTVRIKEDLVSGEHARLSWLGERWHLRDLASRNGTFLNGTRLARGAAAELNPGDKIAFGDVQSIFVLEDASAPVALARNLASGDVRKARDGMLALPSEDEPTACIIEREGGQWDLEMGDVLRNAEDGEVLEVGGQAWTLHLPAPDQQTADAQAIATAESSPTLRLRVSRDEEHVEVVFDSPNGKQSLPPRAHHYTLLTLARMRIAAEAQPDLPDAARGWASVDDLCRMLATDEMKLNVEIYRIRRDLAELGIKNAAAAIERRRSSRQVRLALAHVRIETIV